MAQKRGQKYRTYLSDTLANDAYNIYYRVDDKYPVGAYEYLRVYKGASVYSVVEGAFQKGQYMDVTIGEPYRELNGKATATIKTAVVIWQPHP